MAQLLVSQFLVYGLAWLVGWVIVREERGPIALWSAYCLLQAAGIWLMISMAPVVGGPPIPVPAAMLMLLSYFCANAGVDLFAHQGRMRWQGLWWVLLIAGEAVQLSTALWPGPLHLQAVGYNVSVASLVLAPMLVLRQPLRREFGRWGLLPMVPGALICVLALARSGVILANPEAALLTTRMATNLPLLLATLFAAGAFNVAFLSLVVGRLVRRMHGLLDLDALTGLANRGGLEKRLAAAWDNGTRHGVSLSVAFIDINNFKQINDAGGHEAGDRVIQGVAAALQQSARNTDHVGRWGGDEFMLVMPHTSPDEAAHAVKRLHARLGEAGIPMPLGCPPLTVSIGLATRQDTDASVQALVLRADTAMYRSKKHLAAFAVAPEAV